MREMLKRRGGRWGAEADGNCSMLHFFLQNGILISDFNELSSYHISHHILTVTASCSLRIRYLLLLLLRCDCAKQIELAMKQIEAAGRGVLVYLRGHEGRGIGLGHKLRAYNLQDDGRDTVEANEELGLPVDSREYGIGAKILRDLGVRSMKLMINNPAKYIGLKGYGLTVSGRIPLLTLITKDKRYLETKRAKMGHVYGLEFNSQLGSQDGSTGDEVKVDESKAVSV
ncbi:bifunctional riboflavin biosynthesis protein RIBA 1, chloroplastic-like [Prosopis cineraria]|uniref:bifunctional riboflavin biosynthesis protein RIBA 1, chloroplastic-like n=1 Tax=Prosopis cineraria TaxID=364024 RepID=UPI0024107CC5|nr:bifunctional riboflavin biosynthesis protein RIBA 1, chloroplastic-like [Prosopis cineraria]